MGIAETIPGVSGGTIAFITGIYERLINAIKHTLHPGLPGIWRRDGLAGVWQSIDGAFLFTLATGMVTGLLIGVFGITSLLETYPPVVWAFFFGLIIASAIYIGRQVGVWNAPSIATLLFGIMLAYILTVVNPMQGSTSFLLVFLSGVIAISALILPGISGSFILLLLGMYTTITGAVRGLISDFSSAYLLTVSAFALGCVVGLAAFSRLLSWTFERFPAPTLALLTGFMIGSLNKLWPWRNVLTWRTDSTGESVPLTETNVWPGNYEGDPLVIAAILAIFAGFAIVFILERLGRDEAREETIIAE